MEKAYLTMKNSGASSITLGIIVLVVGVATGILAIVNGAKLLKHKKPEYRQSLFATAAERSLGLPETLRPCIVPERAFLALPVI